MGIRRIQRAHVDVGFYDERIEDLDVVGLHLCRVSGSVEVFLSDCLFADRETGTGIQTCWIGDGRGISLCCFVVAGRVRRT